MSSALQPPRTGEPVVDRVICASVVTSRGSIYATMERIRDAALRHNPDAGVHAALIYQSGWFLHWAEGPEPAVRSLFARIGKDGRHHSQYVVHYSLGPRVLMTPWSMMMSPSIESAGDFGGRVMTLRQRMTSGLQYSPTSVIRRLSSPMRLAPAQGRADPDCCHRVGVCAALGNEAFDLVQWLARRHREPVQSRRVAGEDDLDSGSDIVDFMAGDVPCRVIAVPRSDLGHALRRAFMVEWRFLVLLLSQDGRRNQVLLERVDEAFHGLPGTPDLLLLGPEPGALADALEMARTRGLRAADVRACAHGDPASTWQAVADVLDEVGEPPCSSWEGTPPDVSHIDGTP